jgi:hypothetical protein
MRLTNVSRQPQIIGQGTCLGELAAVEVRNEMEAKARKRLFHDFAEVAETELAKRKKDCTSNTVGSGVNVAESRLNNKYVNPINDDPLQ